MRKPQNNNAFTLCLTLALGIIIGGFAGDFFVSVFPYFKWLGYGKQFGLTSPLVIDLGVIMFQFAFSVKMTVAGLIGLFISALIYKFL